jgi:hypothetical protein
MTAKARPILIIGMNRSGTKWVSNLLCNHPDVAGVQSEREKGILETNVFGSMQSKFDLTSPEDYVGFIELWSTTQFFQVTKADKEMFFELKPRPRSFYRLFEILMEDYAARRGAKFWLQKASPTKAFDLVEHFHDARCVVVRRGMMDTLRSTLQLHMNRGMKRKLGGSVYAYVVQDKILSRLTRDSRVIRLTHEDLRRDTPRQLQDLCGRLGLEYDPEMLRIPYKRNTSFKQGADREKIITPAQKVLIRVSSSLLRLVPLGLLRSALSFRALYREPRPTSLVLGTFRGIRDKYGIES